jgi:hypothetical protein
MAPYTRREEARRGKRSPGRARRERADGPRHADASRKRRSASGDATRGAAGRRQAAWARRAQARRRATPGAPPQRRSRHAGLPRATAGPGDDPVRKGRRARWRSSERKRPGEAMRPARRPTLPTRSEADKTRRSARPGASSESHLDRRHLSKSTLAAHLPRKRGRGSQENRGISLKVRGRKRKFRFFAMIDARFTGASRFFPRIHDFP